MSKKINDDTLWKGRKHWMWFPWTFTTYELTSDRLYEQSGLFSTHYDETLLYKIIDICLERSFLQKIFGTGTLTLSTRSDSQGRIELKNIKNPMDVKRLFSKAVEEERERKKVVGKEFYGINGGHHDLDGDDMFDGMDDMDGHVH